MSDPRFTLKVFVFGVAQSATGTLIGGLIFAGLAYALLVRI